MDPQQMQVFLMGRNYFLKHVNDTLQRFHDQALTIKHFRLHLDLFDPHTLFPLIDHWMKLLATVSDDLEILHLSLFRPLIFLGEPYCLLPNILKTKSLVKLNLEGCLIIDQAFCNHSINFSTMKELSLSFVEVEEHTFQNLISSCPLIEYILLSCCRGLKSIRIHNLPKLKTVQLIRGVEEAVIDAPSLEYFHYITNDSNTSCNINFDQCRNLRHLCLSFPSNIVITSQWFLELFNKFHLLERLELNGCTISERIHISSLELKVLNFTNCCDLEEACNDAPKLCCCYYEAHALSMPTGVLFANNSSSLEFSVRFDPSMGLDFFNLRKFLKNIKPTNLLASLLMDFDNLEEEFIIPCIMEDPYVPPPCIKHLHLQYSSNFLETLPLRSLLIGLLWCCRPSIISIKLKPTLCSKLIIKVLCEMLIGDNDACFCTSKDGDVVIDNPFRSIANSLLRGRD